VKPGTSLFPSGKVKVATKGFPATTKTDIDPEVVTSIDSSVLEDSHVYVHCYYNPTEKNTLIRIWRTTYLVDLASGSKSELLHAENISIAPQWTTIPDRTRYSFLLIFSALPKSCQRFDFREEISQPGGFLVKNIPRNEQDVYHVEIR